MDRRHGYDRASHRNKNLSYPYKRGNEDRYFTPRGGHRSGRSAIEQNRRPADQVRIGVYFGTFDPMHENHMALCKHAIERENFKAVVMVPNGASNGKPFITPLVNRVALIKARLRADPVGCASIFVYRHCRGHGISDPFKYRQYVCADILQEARRKFSNCNPILFQLKGGDKFSPHSFRRQPQPTMIFARSTVSSGKIPTRGDGWWLATAYRDPVDQLSSTTVRRLIRAGGAIPESHLHPSVQAVIREDKCLYASARPLEGAKAILFLCGPPGSGKSTTGRYLAEKTGYTHVSPGEILRHASSIESFKQLEKQAEANKKMIHLHSALLSTAGFLGPSIMQYTKNTGYIFEGKASILAGIMRKLGGAFDLVIHCKCSKQLASERIRTRARAEDLGKEHKRVDDYFSNERKYRDVFEYLKDADEHVLATHKSSEEKTTLRRFLELDVREPLEKCRAKLDAAIAGLIARKPAAKGAPRFLSQSVMTQLVHQFVESVKLGRSALAENVLSGGTIQPDSTAAAEPTPSAAAATNKEPVEPPKPVCLSAAAASFSPSVAATAEAASSSTAEKEEAKPHSPRGQSSGWGPWARAQLAAWRAPYYMTGARNRDTSPVKPMNEFHNWVKDGIYRQHLRPGDAVLELAGGRGGDMWKHAKYRAREVFLTDIDDKALVEAIQRMAARHKRNSRELLPRLNVKALDLRQEGASAEPLRARSNLGQDIKFDFVCCQFALHYFFESASTFNNFARVVVDSLKPGGRFVATCFRAESVTALLAKTKDNRREWVVHGRPILMLGLPASTGTGYGQRVDVLVDTIGQHREFLVDSSELQAALERHGLRKVKETPFGDLYPGYAAERKQAPVMPHNMGDFSFLYYVFEYELPLPTRDPADVNPTTSAEQSPSTDHGPTSSAPPPPSAAREGNRPHRTNRRVDPPQSTRAPHRRNFNSNFNSDFPRDGGRGRGGGWSSGRGGRGGGWSSGRGGRGGRGDGGRHYNRRWGPPRDHGDDYDRRHGNRNHFSRGTRHPPGRSRTEANQNNSNLSWRR